MNRVIVGIGSNILPEHHVPAARQRIESKHHVLAVSSFLRTEPIGFSDQDDFVNGVILLETEMDCDELGQWLKGVEKELGRVRGRNRYGPRTIDLDILVFNGRIVDPDVQTRAFLMACIREVEPDFFN
ncbi:MAG TPA: 2-amino-4-hydroxy-6-hydroxymethyldihydropteridine diphosphokinase [Thermoanaerobaculia bacterium]|nr:2-amino-4-hydroxy-6-hydroxymethyldihydropteridine diphosphokinase [Thermoanaerobaculia bacterium]HUM28771.1 2-amino-4-hydroxy-6-hydroxymethyldihydropteridine diphosphokinase [Thermoanaerobaculia bacterium]HXK67979.1 2-amino-4-hydroxy-6-hydroxymethyldihydropteridine diphosphokinase [Thermoanaerobaculia bacterium]